MMAIVTHLLGPVDICLSDVQGGAHITIYQRWMSNVYLSVDIHIAIHSHIAVGATKL